MTDEHLIISAILALVILSSHATDMILTAKENAFAACVSANTLSPRHEIEQICGE
jgi:hypothetical protein